MEAELGSVTGRFAILTHDHPFFHWDLLVEAGPTARTWRLLEEPGPGRTVRAEEISDHRLVYLDYEGEVSGGRGHVTRWDGGTYRSVEENAQGWRIVLRGSKVWGELDCRSTEVVFGANLPVSNSG